eukprot:8096876-Ditylum_brightwellii.AAC.1
MDGLPYGSDFSGVMMGHPLGTYQWLTSWISIGFPIWDSGCRTDTYWATEMCLTSWKHIGFPIWDSGCCMDT